MKIMDRFSIASKELCCGCGACEAVCPHQAICMKQNVEGFYYPEVKGELCIHCEACKKVCPVGYTENMTVDNSYYGVQIKDDVIRNESSSGAVFVMLARWVLERQGVVFGASMLSGGKVAHIAIEKEEKLNDITKTKYVQSDMTGCYQAIDGFLRADRYVLFVGTACQTEAVRRYIKGTKEKLILADLICYGVPSPGVWEKYVRYLEKKHTGQLNIFYFRDKRNKDSGHTAAYQISGKEYAGSLFRDLFCRAYFRNILIRPSCYKCSFCTTKRKSDVTLGDFWGIEKIRPEFEDGMGTSVLICHTKKAQRIWDEVKAEARWFECMEEDVLQPRLVSPTKCPRKRKLLMTLYRYLPFSIWINLCRK